MINEKILMDIKQIINRLESLKQNNDFIHKAEVIYMIAMIECLRTKYNKN